MMVKKQSREIRNLLNPAFCGEILRNTIKEYENHDKNDFPFSLIFFILPLVLHQDTFKAIRFSTVGQFFSWIDSHVFQSLDLERRTIMLKRTSLHSFDSM
jgi:hypothetical protein